MATERAWGMGAVMRRRPLARGLARRAGAARVGVAARRASLAAGDAKKARDAADNLALGAWTQVADAATAKALRQAGPDFLVIEPETTPAPALPDAALGS